VGDWDVIGEVPNHAYRRVGVDYLEQPAFAQLFAIAQMLGKGTESGRRNPQRRVFTAWDIGVG
jgi:hypothetical protein